MDYGYAMYRYSYLKKSGGEEIIPSIYQEKEPLVMVFVFGISLSKKLQCTMAVCMRDTCCKYIPDDPVFVRDCLKFFSGKEKKR